MFVASLTRRFVSTKRLFTDLQDSLGRDETPRKTSHDISQVFNNCFAQFVGGAVASWLVCPDSEASGPGSGPGRGHCVVFLGKTLPRCLSPSRCINGYRRNAGGNPAMN